MADEPALNGRGLVGPVIVEYQLEVQLGGHLDVDTLEELLELDGPVPAVEWSRSLSR
jgi:hypothetical protein